MPGERYSHAVHTGLPSAASAFWTINTGSALRVKIYELTVIVLGTATVTPVGLGKPANTPVGTAPTTVPADDPSGPASTANVNASGGWSTAPTAPTNFFRRGILPAVIGANITWTFPNGLVVPTSQWMVIWNFGASAASSIEVVASWEE